MTADDFTALTPELWRYAVDHSSFRDDVVLEVEAAARDMGDLAEMQIGGDQAAFMTVIASAIGTRRAIEVGTFLGYGAISIARALPEDGELVICELRDEYADRARAHLEKAGLADRVDIRVGSAVETLRAMEDSGSYDFAFVDADKTGYLDYYEECLRLLRPNGLLMLDNVFRSGTVLDDTQDEGGVVMTALNDRIASDERVDAAMVPIADGITIVRKR